MSKIVVYELAVVDNGVRVINSDGLDFTFNNAEELLKKIIETCDTNKVSMVWDSKENFWQPIFKLLPYEISSDLYSGRGCNYQRIRLWWGITRWGRNIGLRCDFREHVRDNFYNETRKEIKIGELKQYYDWIHDNQSLGQSLELGNKLIETLERMELEPGNITTSSIAVFKSNVLDKMNIPTIFSMPESSLDLHEMAYNCCDEIDFNIKSPADGVPVYSYDLTNAYGSALAELPDIRDAEIVHSTEIPLGCAWGVLRGVIHNKTGVSPLINPDNKNAYIGYWNGFIPLDLYACVVGWGIADVKIKDGWFLFTNNINKPFNDIMHKLYNLRNGDLLQNNLAKSMAVATWGKMLEERNDEYGELFNPIYASMVVNNIKVKVTDFIYHNKIQDSILSARVDGVKSIIELPIQTDKKFGEWRKEVKNG